MSALSSSSCPRGSAARLSATTIFRLSLAITVSLAIMSLVANFCRLNTSFRGTHVLMHWFDLDGEQTIPSFFSSVQLLGAAGVSAWCLRQSRGGERRAWTLLTLGMAFMALDEAVGFHEAGNQYEIVNSDAHPAFSYAWVVPGMAVVVVAGLSFIPFLLKLPRRTAVALILSGAIFVGGAIGMEMVGADLATVDGKDTWPYVFAYTVEETMEMLGIALYIRAVLDHGGPLRWEISRE